MIEEKSEFQKQIDDLLAKEKVSRMSTDNNESVKILKQMAKLCYELNEFDTLNELIVSICKKRGQPKKAQIELVQQCMNYVHEIQDVEKKMSLIKAIQEVCEKKIFLEVEYARCVLLLVKFKENDNEIADAAKILQEVQVETYGSMDKREKLEFILYQMKIMIKKLDYTRLFIISKKIEPKNLQDVKIQDLKITYYSYLVFYYRHEGQYMEVAQSYAAILDTLHNNQELQEKLPKYIDFGFNIDFKNILENFVLYLIITKYSTDKTQKLKDAKEKYQYDLENQGFLLNLINQFLSSELISTNTVDYQINQTEILNDKYEKSSDRLKGEINKQQLDFRKQLIQHNLRVFQLYYESIHLSRISELINVDLQSIEEEICEMIDQQLLMCKIDRLTGVAQFRLRKNENEVLDDWSQNINSVLKMIELTSNYIKREEELYM